MIEIIERCPLDPSAKDIEELKAVFKKWRRIGWKNVCKLWLEERTPEQLKGEGNLIREGWR
jgi:hypothetical protein